MNEMEYIKSILERKKAEKEAKEAEMQEQEMQEVTSL